MFQFFNLFMYDSVTFVFTIIFIFIFIGLSIAYFKGGI